MLMCTKHSWFEMGKEDGSGFATSCVERNARDERRKCYMQMVSIFEKCNDNSF